MRRQLVLLLALSVISALSVAAWAPVVAQEGTPMPGSVTEATDPLPVRTVAILTGPDGINPTHTEYYVDGTDLGHSFVHGDVIYMIFGDTFGPAKADWRSNVGAVIRDDDPSDGLTLDRMITDLPDHAKELLDSKKIDGDEITVIPTYGVSIGDRMILHYMSVQFWGEPGHWTLNSSGLAYSDDDGETWTKDPDMTWPGDSNFGQVAIEKVGDYAYFFGIPGGRFGGAQLARVELPRILEKAAYEYWDGSAWVADEAAAETIIPAPVGELSVRWSSHYQTWVMMYLNEDKYSVVLRTADCLVGPWSEERTVATGAEYPQLYAPYMLPKWNDGPEIYFTMSLFGPYNVSLMETSLGEIAPAPSAGEPECVAPQ